MVVAARKDLTIPERFQRDDSVDPSPQQPFKTEAELKYKRTKRTGDAPPTMKALSVSQQRFKKLESRQVPWTKEAKTDDSPNYYYFDFLCKKTENVGQSDIYVKASIQLLLSSGFLEDNMIEELIWWSDGCGKHFKTYRHLDYVSSLLDQYGLKSVSLFSPVILTA